MPSNTPAEPSRKEIREQKRKKRLRFAAQQSTPDPPSSPTIHDSLNAALEQLPPQLEYFESSLPPSVKDISETPTPAEAETVEEKPIDGVPQTAEDIPEVPA